MPAKRGRTAVSPSSFGAVLYGITLTGLARASLVLVVCMTIGTLSGQGVEPYLGSAVLVFSAVAALTLGRGLRAERSSARDQAGNLYALVLVNYFVAYASFFAHRLLTMPGNS